MKPVANQSPLEIVIGSLIDAVLTVVGRKDLAIARHRRPMEDRFLALDPTISSPSDLSALSDVRPVARRLANALGLGDLARLVDMDLSNLSEFLAGRRGLPRETAIRLIDVEFLLSRAAQVFVGRAAADWLLSGDIRRGGARRIDILAADGVGALLDDLERIAEGVYS